VSWRKLDDAEAHDRYLSDDKIKENVMVERCCACEGEENCLLGFGGETRKKNLFIDMRECNIYSFTYK